MTCDIAILTALTLMSYLFSHSKKPFDFKKFAVTSEKQEMSATKKYTFAEVKQHNTPSDLWVVIHDKVYDVTKFLHEHPGGEEVLEEAAGKNATKDFDEADHSTSAIEQLANFYLGDIVDEERTEKSVSKVAKIGNNSNRLCLAGVSALAVALGSIVLYKGFQMSKSSN